MVESEGSRLKVRDQGWRKGVKIRKKGTMVKVKGIRLKEWD